jgi:hypothetical protein
MKGHQMLKEAEVMPAAAAMRRVERPLVSGSWEALDEGGSALSTPVVMGGV